MKKIILLTCITGALMAESSFYVGFDFGKADNTDKHTSEDISLKNQNSYSDSKIKLGIQADGTTDFQLTFSKISYDEGVLRGSTGSKLYEVGLDIIKEFEVTSSLSPFIKLGVGYGKMDTQSSAYGNVNEFSTNVGIGLSYKLIEHIYVLAGVDYIYRHWNDISINQVPPASSITEETRGSAIKPYIGLNYKF
jgi:opacity protein-like surface antigen